MDDKIIDFKNVTVVRSGTRILDSVDLSIGHGEHTVILGPNGSGNPPL